MTWLLHPARERFAAYAVDWDRLNVELYGRHPFFDSRFVGPPNSTGCRLDKLALLIEHDIYVVRRVSCPKG
jgi:hypothetical protein